MSAPNVVTGTAYPPRIYTAVLPIFAAQTLANSQVLKLYIPHKFRVVSARVRVGETAWTGASKTANLTVQINGTAVTGGVIACTSANTGTAWAAVNGSAITANNTSTGATTVEAAVSNVAAFSAGTGWVEFTIQDLDNGGAQ